MGRGGLGGPSAPYGDSAMKPPGGAACREGRSCFKLQRRAVRHLRELCHFSLPDSAADPDQKPGASPSNAQVAGVLAITCSPRPRHLREPRGAPCKLRLLHLPPNPREPWTEPWPMRGCSCWASSWLRWDGLAPSSALPYPSGRFTPTLGTTS